jgi:hypothetical protein
VLTRFIKIQGINITVEPQHHVRRQIYAYFWLALWVYAATSTVGGAIANRNSDTINRDLGGPLQGIIGQFSPNAPRPLPGRARTAGARARRWTRSVHLATRTSSRSGPALRRQPGWNLRRRGRWPRR